MTAVLLGAEMTLRGLLRRRMSVAVLVLLPLALYVVSSDTVGRSVRALVFGLTWAVSTVAYFATASGRELDPRLALAGWTRRRLWSARTTALLVVAVVLAVGFWALVALDQPVRSAPWVAAAMLVTGVVAVAIGTAVGVLVPKEMEGTLVLFFLAGLQAVTDPAARWSVALPFWSSRELATYAVDGAAAASATAGLVHAAGVVAASALISRVAGTRRG